MMTETEARAKGAEMMDGLLGADWQLKIWDNCGWHCMAINKFVSVHLATAGKYFAMLTTRDDIPGCGDSFFENNGRFDTPQEAVDACIADARSFMNKVRRTIDYVEKKIKSDSLQVQPV
jgi:hypothetical protein